MSTLLPYQRDFIRFAIDTGVLSFGSFTLKSGRVSPYFFNAGLFNTGSTLAALSGFYGAAIDAWMSEPEGLAADLLFGPAYKGIPLAAATAVQLAENFDRDLPWAFNRKEAKDHGEGGLFVGAPMKGRALIIDDVITAGTAIREVFALLDGKDCEVAGVIVAIDRAERGTGELSAIGQIRAEHGIDVRAIVTVDDIIDYLKTTEGFAEHVPAMLDYRKTYGA